MDADDASQASGESNVIILAQLTDHPIAPACCPTNKNYVLLDSQLTVNLFSNPDCVTNIRLAGTLIRVHCNKGTMLTTKQANFGNTEVYFDSNGIANVLSLFCFGQKYRITYDSQDRGGVFQVFTAKGVMEFKPTDKGFHALDHQENPKAAHLLVNDADLLYDQACRPPSRLVGNDQLQVTTVHENFEGFTKQQVKNADRARHLMNMVATLLEPDFQGMVHHNFLKDCPVTNEDVVNAHRIFGPDLAYIRGKTVRHKPERVVTDYADIPRDFFHATQLGDPHC